MIIPWNSLLLGLFSALVIGGVFGYQICRWKLKEVIRSYEMLFGKAPIYLPWEK